MSDNSSNVEASYNELKTQFEKLKTDIESFQSGWTKTLVEDKKELDNLTTFVNDTKQSIEAFNTTTQDTLITIKNDIEQKKVELDSYYNKLFKDKDSISSQIDELKSDLDDYHSELLEGSAEEKSIKEKIQETSQQIFDYQKKIFGYQDTKKKEDGTQEIINHPGIKDDLEKLAIDYKQSLKDNEDAYNLLRDKIEGLLPQAAAAGLAYDYNQAKQDYGLKFKSVRNANNVLVQEIDTWRTFWHSAFSYSLFLLPLGLLIFFLFKMALDGFTLDQIMERIVLAVPFIWLSIFGQKSISIKRRLYEEYNHKEKVMKLYSGLSDENYGLAKEKKDKLIDIVLDTIRENPSEILGKGETMMDKILDKIKEIRIRAYLNQIKAESDSEEDNKK